MKLGFIGVGRIGSPMAAQLLRAGHQLVVHDVRREAAASLLSAGAVWADSPAAVECPAFPSKASRYGDSPIASSASG